jgi:CRP-like cAMP-binding protein
VIAVTTVSARVLTAADFSLIARSHPRIHAKLIAAVGESLSDRLRRANAVIASLMR